MNYIFTICLGNHLLQYLPSEPIYCSRMGAWNDIDRLVLLLCIPYHTNPHRAPNIPTSAIRAMTLRGDAHANNQANRQRPQPQSTQRRQYPPMFTTTTNGEALVLLCFSLAVGRFRHPPEGPPPPQIPSPVARPRSQSQSCDVPPPNRGAWREMSRWDRSRRTGPIPAHLPTSRR